LPIDPPPHAPPRPEGTPADVVITWEAAKPQTDPALGIALDVRPTRPVTNRLVTVGDSLTQGFQSLAIFKTDLSWPALVAGALGLSASEFRYPTYEGHGGLPFNLEVCIRGLQAKFGRLDLGKDPLAVIWLLAFAHEIKHWWTHDADHSWNPPPGLNHNLAVYSYDVQTACVRSLAEIEAAIAKPPGGFFHPLTPNDVDRAARRVLVHADPSMSLLDAAVSLGRQGSIETLVVALGSNNVLDVVIGLDYQWSTDEASRGHGRVWSPTLFESDWRSLVNRVREVDADHVILATVPHVTIVPLCAAVGNRLRDDSRYYEYYTHYWLRDSFDSDRDPHLTGDQARAIDSAIDQYNAAIVASVREARASGLDWRIFEMSGLLDRLAWRRYLNQPKARPSWWDQVGGAYPLPEALEQLSPTPDTTFFEADGIGRTSGGLIALDGVHPTTVGYGVVAAEVAKIMKDAGVAFAKDIDFADIIELDTLIAQPPVTLSEDFHILGWLNEHLDMIKALMRHESLT